MRKRIAQWRKRGGLTVKGRVVVANSLISSMATYLAAFRQPTDEQLQSMDNLIWAAVWGGDPEQAGRGRKGWLGREGAC